jgi:hypothetical protein
MTKIPRQRQGMEFEENMALRQNDLDALADPFSVRAIV